MRRLPAAQPVMVINSSFVSCTGRLGPYGNIAKLICGSSNPIFVDVKPSECAWAVAYLGIHSASASRSEKENFRASFREYGLRATTFPWFQELGTRFGQDRFCSGKKQMFKSIVAVDFFPARFCVVGSS
jgi:hypothetical protein